MTKTSSLDLLTSVASGDTSTSAETPSSNNSSNIFLETLQGASNPAAEQEQTPNLDPSEDTNSEEAPAESQEETPANAADVEEVIITDESGKKRIKVDFSDREKLKKYVAMASGMRKFQAERDQLKSRLGALEPEHEKLKAGWGEIEGAFSKGGVDGIINLLLNDPQGAQKYYSQKRQRELQRESASPEQIARMDLEETVKQERAEREKVQAEMAAFMEESRSNKQQTELQALESQLSPAFEKYRFAGKLGDNEVEQMYDKAVWGQVLGRLQQLPDEQALNNAVIERTFRDVSSKFRKAISSKVEENTKKVMASKKMTAQEKASAATVRAPQKSVAQIPESDEAFGVGSFSDTLHSLFSRGMKF